MLLNRCCFSDIQPLTLRASDLPRELKASFTFCGLKGSEMSWSVESIVATSDMSHAELLVLDMSLPTSKVNKTSVISPNKETEMHH